MIFVFLVSTGIAIYRDKWNPFLFIERSLFHKKVNATKANFTRFVYAVWPVLLKFKSLFMDLEAKTAWLSFGGRKIISKILFSFFDKNNSIVILSVICITQAAYE